jgi:hypothetical protein
VPLPELVLEFRELVEIVLERGGPLQLHYANNVTGWRSEESPASRPVSEAVAHDVWRPAVPKRCSQPTIHWHGRRLLRN